MESLSENKPLLYSLMFSCSGIIVLASGIIPDISQQFQLVALPGEVGVLSCLTGVELSLPLAPSSQSSGL